MSGPCDTLSHHEDSKRYLSAQSTPSAYKTIKYSKQDCKIYVDNLPDTVPWQTLKDVVRNSLAGLMDDTEHSGQYPSLVRSANVGEHRTTGQRIGVIALDCPEAVPPALEQLQTTMSFWHDRALTWRTSTVPEEKAADFILVEDHHSHPNAVYSPIYSSSSLPCTVHVENLPSRITWQMLKDFMNSVSGSTVRSANIYHHDVSGTGASGSARRLYGLVVFRSAEDAQSVVYSLGTLRSAAAVDLNDDFANCWEGIAVRLATQDDLGKNVKSAMVQVRVTNSETDTNPPPVNQWNDTRSVYVTNVAKSVRWMDLKDFFRQVGGKVRSANVYNNNKNDRHGDEHTSYGVVVFEHPDDASKARHVLDGSVLKGRAVQLYSAQEYFAPQQQQQQQQQTRKNPAALPSSAPPATNLESSTDYLLFDYYTPKTSGTDHQPRPPQSQSTTSSSKKSDDSDIAACTVNMTHLPSHVTLEEIVDWFRQHVGDDRLQSVTVHENGRGVAVLARPQDAQSAVSNWRNDENKKNGRWWGSNTVMEVSSTATTASTEMPWAEPQSEEEYFDGLVTPPPSRNLE